MALALFRGAGTCNSMRLFGPTLIQCRGKKKRITDRTRRRKRFSQFQQILQAEERRLNRLTNLEKNAEKRRAEKERIEQIKIRVEELRKKYEEEDRDFVSEAEFEEVPRAKML